VRIKGVGIDIISVKRIKDLIETYGERFLNRVFTENEIEYSKKLFNYAEAFAGRFAAKEAIIKVKGKMIPFKKIEILNMDDGKPYAKGFENINISISHEREFAIAIAIEMEYDEFVSKSDNLAPDYQKIEVRDEGSVSK
jgi:phosphopantetheine--protein transferase-like protein